LRDTTIRAPFDGYVQKRLVSMGEFVKNQTAVMTIVRLDPLKVTGEIPEGMAPWIANGQPVELRVDAYPDKIFTGKTPGLLSLTLRLGQIPEGVRTMLLDGLKEALGKAEDKPGETKAQKAFRVALTKEIQRIVENVLKDGDELNADIDIDGQTKQLAMDLTLTGKANSALAKNIAKLGERKTLFAGVLHKDAALNGLINFELPADLQGALAGILEETIGQVSGTLKDEDKRKQAVQLLEAIKPSLTSGDFDAAFSLRGPHKDKQFTLVAGLKLKDGDKLAAKLLELVKELPEKDQKQIQLDADKVGNVAIHKLMLDGSLEGDAKRMFGDHPLYVALRNDAVFLAIGQEGLAALKAALAAQPTTAPAVQFEVSLARFAAAMEKNADAAALAQKLAGAGDDARLRVTLEGGPSLRVRFTMALSALQIFGQQK